MNWPGLKQASIQDLVAWAEGRKNPVPEQVVRKLAAKCEPPTWTEGHGLLLVDGEAK